MFGQHFVYTLSSPIKLLAPCNPSTFTSFSASLVVCHSRFSHSRIAGFSSCVIRMQFGAYFLEDKKYSKDLISISTSLI